MGNEPNPGTATQYRGPSGAFRDSLWLTAEDLQEGKDLTLTVEDVVAANGVETITTRTFTFSEVTSNGGASANNDGGEGSRKISCCSCATASSAS